MKAILRPPADRVFCTIALSVGVQLACITRSFGIVGCTDIIRPCPPLYEKPSGDCPGDDGPSDDPGLWCGCTQPAPPDKPSEPPDIIWGMPSFWISQPYISARLEDVPLGYWPSHGLPVAFHLSYRQRGAVPENPAVFGVGTNWSTSFRAFLVDATSVQVGLFRLHRGGAGLIDYYVGTPQFFDASLLTTPDNGQTYRIEYPNGATDVFAKSFVNGDGNTLYFLTAKTDPAGNTLTFNYATNQNIMRLSSVTDPDNRSTQLYYENSAFTNQITKVVDPFNRTNLLKYDGAGYLTNVVDVAGLASSFGYDAGTRRSWITNVVTPYGTTAFRYGGVNADTADYFDGGNQVNRFVEVTLPNGGKQLYLYRQDCSNFMSPTNSPLPSTSPFANALDNVDQDQRNSFHWSPLQYDGLSSGYVQSGDVANLTTNDYTLGSLRHWLVDPNTGKADRVLSLARAASQTGTNNGQLTWFDYQGKISGHNNSNGTSALPLFKARVLPDGSKWFDRYVRNSRGSVTNFVSTYSAADGSVALRTNIYTYATGEIDMTRHVGPQGEQVVSNYFNAYHQPLASYNALNEATLYTYNVNHQVTSIVGRSGLTTTNYYFATVADTNRLHKTIDLEISRTNSYTYYDNGLVYSHADERGLTTTNFWDNLQHLTGVLYPDGTTISNIYTALDITATKDRLGYWSYTGYNSIREKIAETNANNVVTRYGYCDCGALMAVTNAWNTSVQMVTSYNYDFQGNRTYVYLPDDTVLTWYDALGRQTTNADGWGSRYFYYNNQGLRTNTSNAYGTEQGTIFDIEDRPIYVTDANTVTITNTYDSMGRLSTRTQPDGGVERFGYSARGLIAYTNQLTNITFYAYDEASRKTFETNANLQVIQFRYDPSGNLTNLIDGKGQATKWNYDEYGRLTNKLDQTATEILRYTYDAGGRLSNRWSMAKGTTIYGYDPVGNLTNINYPASTDVRFTYDALNRASTMVDAVGTTAYAYAAGGQLWTEDGPWSSDTVTNSYNNRLRTALSLAQPTGAWTNGFGYDPAKRLTNVASQAGAFGYTFVGQASRLTQKLSLPNSSYITNTYDRVARLTGTWLKNSTNGTLDSSSYVYNVGNQRTNLTRTDGSTYDFTYDAIGQLKVANGSVNAEDRGYTYDTAWNLNYRTNNGALSTFYVDTKNELTNVFNAAYSYDGNGNLTNANGGTNAFIYDDENRLVQWYYYQAGTPTTDGDLATEFVYDGLGRLRERWEYVWNSATSPIGASWRWTSTTRYIYDGWRVIQERDTNNTPLVSYTRGTDLSGSLEGAGGIGGLLARSHGYSSGNWSTHNFYHADGNGNITYLVDSSQAKAAEYRYDPFGNTISSSGTLASANVNRFSSKEQHINSGLYYYGFRWYSPNLQRWLNRDPLGDHAGTHLAFWRYYELGVRPHPGQLLAQVGFYGTLVSRLDTQKQRYPFELSDDFNLYSFVANDPLLYVDYLGLSFWCRVGNGLLGALSGAGTGAVTGLTTGAIVGGLVSGGPGIVPGAISGLVGGAIGGAIGGFISGAALSGPNLAPGPALGNGAIAGVVAGIGAGIGGGIRPIGDGPYPGRWSNN